MVARFRRGHRSRGQSVAEFALVFPVLMLILGAVIQFGIIFWGQNTLNQIARDTGRWAASQSAPCSTSAEMTAATPAVVATANAIAAQSSLIGYSLGSWTSPTNVTVSWTPAAGPLCPPKSNQDVAWVTITLNDRVPVFLPWLPGNGNLTTTTQFRMEPKPR